MLITESYRELNSRLHESNPTFGISGHRYARQIISLCNALQSRDVLDYGCGKKTLEAALGFQIHNYDPAIPGLDSTPEPHDIVACTDVLEHIEPDCLDDVLKDIRRVTKRAAYLLVATGPALKCLADGRNAHLIQEPLAWWTERFERADFKINQHQENKGGFAVICE